MSSDTHSDPDFSVSGDVVKTIKQQAINDNVYLQQAVPNTYTEVSGINYYGVAKAITFSSRKTPLKNYLKKVLDIRKRWKDNEVQMDDGILNKYYLCCACDLQFHFQEELEEHIARPTSHLIFRCEICLRNIEVFNLCQIHFHACEFHVNQNGLFPKKIPMELLQVGLVGETITVKEVCPECRKSVGSIVAHLWCNDSKDGPHQCPYCTFITSNDCRYNLHIKVHKNIGPFRCPDCAKFFQNSVELNLHLNKSCRHTEQVIRFFCSDCGFIFRNSSSLENHIFFVHNPNKYECHICLTKFNIASKRNLHYEECHLNDLSQGGLRRSKAVLVSHSCSICGEKNLKGCSYERHVREHLCHPDCKFTMFICVCGFITMYKGTYLAHKSIPCLTSHFSPLSNSSAELKICSNCYDAKFYNGKEPFICEPCETEQKSEDVFYKCSLCMDFIKYSMNVVILHLQSKHNLQNDKTPYKYVDRIFLSNKRRKKPSIHKFQRSLMYKCKKCLTAFTKKKQLRFHYESVHRKNSQCFYCTECGENFKSVRAVSVHLQFHNIKIFEDSIIVNSINNKMHCQFCCSTSDDSDSDTFSCRVCKKKLGNTLQYHHHLRSHGLYFLKKKNKTLNTSK